MLETTKIPQANSVLYHNNFVFSQDLVERFYQDGFLVIDHIFSESEMIALNDVLSRPLAKNKAGGGSIIGHYIL